MIMKHYFLALCLSLSCYLTGQVSADIRIVTNQSNDRSTCYTIQLDYHGENPTSLASQNYRLFYDASAMTLLDGKEMVFLPEELYTFNIVQHNEGVDASGVGDLSFEHNLGFINATIIFQDPRSEGLVLQSQGEWNPIFQLCFADKESDSPKQLILAREDLTSSYGRAFVELSAVDQSGAVYSLQVKEYFDSIK